MFTRDEISMIYDSIVTRILQVQKLIPSFDDSELKYKYESELVELEKLSQKIAQLFMSNQ